MADNLQERIEKAGPKRILALDGGGIRGLITLGFLERIESILTKSKPGSKLRDHFDLIGGTSTGAIIAAGLALGLDVATLKKSYIDLGRSIFGRATGIGGLTKGLLAAKFEAAAVERALEGIIGDRTLASSDITTGLCIVVKRFDTNSVWPIVNAPANKYTFHETKPNGSFLLRKVVRASTAAPTYFDPEFITLGADTYGFIDGGVSMHNNPALQLLLVATIEAFGFKWGTADKPISIVSIGTGDWPRSIPLASWEAGSMPVKHVGNLLGMMMEDASALNETILQALAQGRNRRDIDRLTGALTGKLFGETNLRYERYQVELTEPFFRELDYPEAYVGRIDAYREMDNIDHMEDLFDLGLRAAERKVQPEDLA